MGNANCAAENIEVYNILAHSIGMESNPNNGTLRLPLKPAGTHRPDDMPTGADDPPPTPMPEPSEQPERPVLHEGSAEPDRPTLPPRPSPSSESQASSSDKIGDVGGEAGSEHSGSFKDKVKGALDWVSKGISRMWDKIRGGNAAR